MSQPIPLLYLISCPHLHVLVHPFFSLIFPEPFLRLFFSNLFILESIFLLLKNLSIQRLTVVFVAVADYAWPFLLFFVSWVIFGRISSWIVLTLFFNPIKIFQCLLQILLNLFQKILWIPLATTHALTHFVFARIHFSLLDILNLCQEPSVFYYTLPLLN